MDDTERVADFIAGTTYDDIPGDVIDIAKKHFRDTIGVAIAGSNLDIGRIVTDYVSTSHPGDAATVISTGAASPEGAAFANGVYAHALEWDDTPGGPHHLSHPSPPILPAALATTEHMDASPTDLLTGYVVGVDVLSHLELASFPDHYFHGWHDTGTYGVFGAMAAAASIAGLDSDAIRHAIGIAASSSAGLRKNNGTMTKPYHAGNAACNGIRAALLADAGFTADPEIIEGRIGYGAVYSPGEYDNSHLETFGDDWHFRQYGYKPFPGITFHHGAQVALLRLVTEEDLTPDEVSKITVELKEEAWDTLWNHRPSNPFEAIASAEFSLAVILRERDHGLDHFTTEYVTAPETQAQIEKVTGELLEDESFDIFGARVTVETTSGQEFVEEEHYSPLAVSDERLEEKFYSCVQTVYDRDVAERLDAISMTLDELEETDELFRALGPP